MPFVNWTNIDQPIVRTGVSIADPWIVAIETLRDATHLQIKAEGAWVTIDGLVAECGPNGLVGLPIQGERLIIADCPLGCLIGKFGGNAATLASSASAAGAAPPAAVPIPAAQIAGPAGPPAPATTGVSEGRPFAIGAYCVTKIPDGFVGPLFLGFNSLVRPVRVTDLRITIASATPSP
jgi:hypothetical protein